MKKFINFITCVFKKDFWVKEFPHPDECWDCIKGSCEGCSFR